MENSQQNSQKVKFIPIHVEGRDEPVINRGHDEPDGCQSNAFHTNANASFQSSPSSNSSSAFADSSSGPFQNHQGTFGRPTMNFGNDMGFGQEIPMPTGSIFDRAKDFPVRDFFDMRTRRSESPINVHQQPVRNPSGGRQNQSQERQLPVHHEQQRSTTPQRPSSHNSQQQPPPPPQFQEQQRSQSQQNNVEQDSVPAKQKAIEDSIQKIQKIQQSVVELMESVEKYDGSNHKEYMYLDEMLTQNLLKLDNIDAEGKENIKSARREAIKCINHLISILEMKNEEAKAMSASESCTQVEIYGKDAKSNQLTSAEESLEQKVNSAAANGETTENK